MRFFNDALPFIQPVVRPALVLGASGHGLAETWRTGCTAPCCPIGTEEQSDRNIRNKTTPVTVAFKIYSERAAAS